jgi:hypothetical protein
MFSTVRPAAYATNNSLRLEYSTTPFTFLRNSAPVPESTTTCKATNKLAFMPECEVANYAPRHTALPGEKVAVDNLQSASKHVQVRPGAESVFLCDEETKFYGDCVQAMVFDRKISSDRGKPVLEFGAGDGTAIIRAMLHSQASPPPVLGFEISPSAAALAQQNVSNYGLEGKYKVHNSCFFEGASQYSSNVLISNPPYLPAPNDDIMMPQLFGGKDGGGLTRVLSWIKGMQQEGRAFLGKNSYTLLGLLFCKHSAMDASLNRYNDALNAFSAVI